MAKTALIIFDIDGTLFQTDRVTVPAVQRTFADYGLPVPDAETICSFFGAPVEDYEAWLAEQCPAARADEIVEATNRRELAQISETGRLYPGVREALDELNAAEHRLYLCSNGPGPYVEEFLDAHHMRAYFQGVYTRGTRYNGKRDMVRDILASAPNHFAVVIGDRRDDIDAAHANGARAVGAAYGFGKRGELDEADAIVQRPTEIPGAIAELWKKEKQV